MVNGGSIFARRAVNSIFAGRALSRISAGPANGYAGRAGVYADSSWVGWPRSGGMCATATTQLLPIRLAWRAVHRRVARSRADECQNRGQASPGRAAQNQVD